MDSIVHKIEKVREAKRVAKSTLADKIGVARETVYNWTDESLKVSTLLKICKVLDTPVSYFFPEANQSMNTVNDPGGKYTKTQKDCKELEEQMRFYKGLYEQTQKTANALTSAVEMLTEKKKKAKA